MLQLPQNRTVYLASPKWNTEKTRQTGSPTPGTR